MLARIIEQGDAGMAEHDRQRRAALGLGLAGLAGLTAAGTARAQTPTSTWDRIRTTGEVRIGVVPGEPWFYKDVSTGAWGGIGTLAGEAIAHDLNVKLVTVETTWAAAVAGLQAGQYDVMFVLDATPQRALALDFPVQPFFYYAQGVLVCDGTPAQHWSDLNKPEVTIGVALGTAPERDVTARLPKATIKRFPGLDPALLAFQAGQLNVLCFYHPALVLMQQKTHFGTVVLPEPIRYSATSAGVRREVDKTWRDWLGTTLDFYYTTGQTQVMYETYLIARGIDPAKAPPVVRELWAQKS
ncbi:transporter substrate-binding domain-containing protein [Acidisphaera sp. L21]|uniref:transporter substrate-binding domain-containing protein n=1 Tax=Acidisphaera sp. L21 TaxID=1641851 RepID=UPI001C202A82|nr:transporter substrate-binding domain-containing protein [Acidisphaera sp. L21]